MLPQNDAKRFLNKHHKPMLIVAHQDDDVIGAGFLLQNHASVYVSYCTDGGAALDGNFWRSIGLSRRSEFVDLRIQEAIAALKLSGAHAEPEFHSKVDGSLHEHLNVVANELRSTIAKRKPEFILTHAFEHGHPDHDCCSFLSAQLAQNLAFKYLRCRSMGGSQMEDTCPGV